MIGLGVPKNELFDTFSESTGSTIDTDGAGSPDPNE
jgi:hypothetical protein